MTILDGEGLERVDYLPKQKDHMIVCRARSIHSSSMLSKDASVTAPKTASQPQRTMSSSGGFTTSRLA